MPKRVKIEPHLSSDELERRYQAQNVIERSHYQTIWLLALGNNQEVAEVTGYGLSWIYELVRSYNRSGPGMLGDHRHHNQAGHCWMMCSRHNHGCRKALPMVVCGLDRKLLPG